MAVDHDASQLLDREAKESNHLLSSVMDVMTDVILQTGADDKIQSVSPSMQSIYGYQPIGIFGASLLNYLHPNDRQRFADWKATARPNSQDSLQVRFLHANGSYVWSELFVKVSPGHPELNNDIILVLRDIHNLHTIQEKLRRLATVAEKTDNIVIITDPESRIEWVNDSFLKTTLYTLDEVIGKKPRQLLQGPQKGTDTEQFIQAQLKLKQGFQLEILNYNKLGEAYWVRSDFQPVFSENGELEHYIAIESDITKHKSEFMLMQTENEILRWIQKMSDVIFFIDRIESVWTQFRDMAIQLLGIQAGVYVIQKDGEWHIEDWFGLDGVDIDTLFKDIEADATKPIPDENEHYRFIQGSDRLKEAQGAQLYEKVAEFRYDVYLDHFCHSIMYLYYIQPTAVLRPIVLSLMEFFRLALQVVTQRALLKRQNEQDPLTHISNRRGLENRMESYFLVRQPVQAVFLLFDLDGFKKLNDSLGHQHGDATLKMVAKYFKMHVRLGDWFARLGGDEFVLVLHETKWEAALIDKLKRLVSECPVFQKGLGLTMGAVNLPEEATNFQEAYRLADERMYLGKRLGKHRLIGPGNEIIEF